MLRIIMIENITSFFLPLMDQQHLFKRLSFESLPIHSLQLQVLCEVWMGGTEPSLLQDTGYPLQALEGALEGHNVTANLHHTIQNAGTHDAPRSSLSTSDRHREASEVRLCTEKSGHWGSILTCFEDLKVLNCIFNIKQASLCKCLGCCQICFLESLIIQAPYAWTQLPISFPMAHWKSKRRGGDHLGALQVCSRSQSGISSSGQPVTPPANEARKSAHSDSRSDNADDHSAEDRSTGVRSQSRQKLFFHSPSHFVDYPKALGISNKFHNGPHVSLGWGLTQHNWRSALSCGLGRLSLLRGMENDEYFH